MPFPSAVSGANQTTYRAGGNFQRFLAVPIPGIMLQFAPNANASGFSNAQIPYTTADVGTHANVLLGMTVIATPSSDWKADLKNVPEDCLITYVRKAATSTTVDIGETSYLWTTGHTVTLIDDWRVHERRTRIDGQNIKKDYDLAYRQPLPRIYDLYSDAVLASGATYDYSPTPSAEAMASGASISSWAWQVIEGGALTHTSSSATPTFTLDTGINWLHVTATDDNGNSNFLAVMIVVIPPGFDSVVHQAVIGTVNYDLNSGNRADLTAYGDVSAWVPGSPAMVMTQHYFADDSTSLVVDMVGWLDTAENTISGDEQFGIKQQFSASIIGVTQAMEAIRLPGFPANETTSQTLWGHFARLTVYDAIWYILSEHSTVANVAAIDMLAAHTTFRFPVMTINSGALPEIINGMLFRAMGSMVSWSPQGELFLRISLPYETTDANRDGATVYATYLTSDCRMVGVRRPPPDIQAFATVNGGFGSYNTTAKTSIIVESQAPGGFESGVLIETFDGVILTANLSLSSTALHAGKFSANHYFAANESVQLDIEIIPGYRILPSCHQWHKVTLTASDLLDGQSLDTNTRFICTSVSSSYNASNGSLSNRASLREETDGGTSYLSRTQFVPLNTQQNLPTYPIASVIPGLADFVDLDDQYGIDFTDTQAGQVDTTLPEEVAAEEQVTLSDEVLEVSLKGGAIVTTLTTASGTNYKLEITGDGKIGNGETTTFDFDLNGERFPEDDGWEFGDGGASFGDGPGAFDGYYNHIGGGSTETASMTLTITLPNVYVSSMVTREIHNNTGGAGTITVSAGAFSEVRALDSAFGDNTWNINERVNQIVIALTTTQTFAGVAVKYIKVTHQGNRRGDAFYYGYEAGGSATAYSSGKGFTVDGSAPTAPAFNPSHTYQITVAGTDATLSLAYIDEDSDYSDNEDTNLRVEITALS